MVGHHRMVSEEARFHGIPEQVDVGDGITLRRYREDDVAPLVAATNATLDSLRPWMPWAQQPVTVEGQLEWFRETTRAWDDGVGFHYGVFAADGELIGGAGFHVRNGPGVLEIGYWLGRAHEGRGIMTRVTRRLTEVAADVEGVSRVEIHCDPDNLRSAAIPERLGYRLVELRDAEVTAPGQTGKLQVWAVDVPPAGVVTT